ncbi:hypothetical protein F5144DRAFT_634638 [Chaetomium tenue]|uniref:Uncharacterized protein n=1 Tax=Chaetomium tenue TaxID=1854479 RepID=A0ACB7PM61_9PEZI|nr:hypothetical protein F5144DRAFT_634638 [Chaetomium globosum]
MGRYYRDQYDWYECDWCRTRPGWSRRPCLVRTFVAKGLLRAKREECENVRMENAAKRNKTLPKVYRRAVKVAATEADEAKDEAILNSRDARGADDGTDTKEGMSPLPAASKQTPRPEHHQGNDSKKGQQRQPKSCTGLKGMIEEGVSLASDGGDVARIHASNWKAWPRGQEPIAADETGEDKEVAELVRQGFIGVEGLRVDRDDIGWGVCPYTVRFVETREKGRKGGSRGRQGVQLVGPGPLHAKLESDWWYLGDEACELKKERAAGGGLLSSAPNKDLSLADDRREYETRTRPGKQSLGGKFLMHLPTTHNP